MLTLAGFINILISIAHIIGLFWAEKMFEVTGIANEMRQLAQISLYLPYLITIFVSLIFLIFGLYAFSANEKIRKFPYQKIVILFAASVYLIRGFGELTFDYFQPSGNQTLETIYSLTAIAIG